MRKLSSDVRYSLHKLGQYHILGHKPYVYRRPVTVHVIYIIIIIIIYIIIFILCIVNCNKNYI